MPEPRPLTPERARLFRRIMLGGMLVLFVLAALVAELGARWYERHRTTPPDYFPQMYYPHKRLRYGLVPNLDYYGWFRINSLGFRGREFAATKPPGVLRVVCLGASTTFDIGSIGTARPWPEVMEEQLRARLGTDAVEVLNLGIPGSVALDSLIDMQLRVIALQPDLVIVYQGHNDFVYSIPPPAAALFPLESAPRSSFTRWLTNHSVLYAKTIGRIIDRLSGLFGSGSSVAESASARDARLDRGLADYRNNIASLAAVARANHIPLVLPKIVLPYPQDAAPGCHVCANLPAAFNNLDAAKVKAMFERYDGVLTEAAAAGEGVYHIPTEGFVPSEDRYYHDPIHFGPEGSVQMGTKLAEALTPILTQLRAPASE